MELKPDWGLKGGKMERLAVKSGSPIDKKDIGPSMLNFIYEKLADHTTSLVSPSSDFEMEFRFFTSTPKTVLSKGIIRIILKPSKEKIDITLVGTDADEFIKLVNNNLIPPDSQN